MKVENVTFYYLSDDFQVGHLQGTNQLKLRQKNRNMDERNPFEKRFIEMILDFEDVSQIANIIGGIRQFHDLNRAQRV